MKAKHQRLILILAALAALFGAGLLAASALREEAAYFYAPNDVKTKGVEPGRAIRLGGMVVQGSLARAADGVTIHFDVTDGKATVPAIFNGIAPDLFKEGSGVIAEGAFDQSGRPAEHTSGLQSLMRRAYAVCCLKQNKNLKHTIHRTYSHN